MICDAGIDSYWMSVLTWVGWGLTIILAIIFLILVVERVAIKDNALGEGIKKLLWFIMVLFGISIISSIYLLIVNIKCN